MGMDFMYTYIGLHKFTTVLLSNVDKTLLTFHYHRFRDNFLLIKYVKSF